MSKVELVWATPSGEQRIAYMARVSNPTNQNNTDSAPKLLKYLIKHNHWSPFEMVNVCMQIETTRDIARQILRHRSFSFQEFSQRYAVSETFDISECRLQDEANRQNSLELDLGNNHHQNYSAWWDKTQKQLLSATKDAYNRALDMGIAKEVARKILPEGLTGSRMYMNGTLRSWIHYCDIRCSNDTQKEHREVANQCKAVLISLFPSLYSEE